MTDNSDDSAMQCINNGPWHLGISSEACLNAGGEWFRTPCVTLKETIDSRPAKFNLEDPLDGTCQDNLKRLETAFVSVSTSHIDFPFKENEDGAAGCFRFCQSLPGYSTQTGMMVKHEGSRSYDGRIVEALSCTCLYQNDMLPSRELLPSYATLSLPTFTLINARGMALGLKPKVNCNADDIDLSIEAQVSDPNNPRQQFQLTHDGRIVSVRCPEKALTMVPGGANGSVSSGAGLKLMNPFPTVVSNLVCTLTNTPVPASLTKPLFVTLFTLVL